MTEGKYEAVIRRVFFDHYVDGIEAFDFARAELVAIAGELGIAPKNYGDILYSFRYRSPLPDDVRATAPVGTHWVILPAGAAVYRFRTARESHITPNANLVAVKIPDATPEIIAKYALTDEQALLAKVRYNRLVDVFLGVVAYSLQNHLRTAVPELGQIEIDELYVGLNAKGAHFVIPVQAKGGADRIGLVQTFQDLAYCSDAFPQLLPRAVAVQFMPDDTIAMLNVAIMDSPGQPLEVKVLEERHYRLVAATDVTLDDLAVYGA